MIITKKNIIKEINKEKFVQMCEEVIVRKNVYPEKMYIQLYIHLPFYGYTFLFSWIHDFNFNRYTI